MFTFVPWLHVKYMPGETDTLPLNSTGDKSFPLVLLAEDEEYNIIYFKHVFNRLPVKFIHVENGKMAVEMCRKYPSLELVLMDIRMPVMDGIEAARQIREFRPELPVIALSAYDQTGYENRIDSAGFTTFLTKPVSKDHLKEIVKQFVSC